MSLKQELWLPGMDTQTLVIPEESIEDYLDIQIPVNSTETEFEKMVRVNKSNRDFLSGQLDLDTYLDILEWADLDPSFHLQEAAWQAANLFNY